MTNAIPGSYDAVIVGSGPNGLAAAVTLARQGQKVLVLEAAPTVGGGLRTDELTLPGFRHDVCSSVYPLVPVSPFFKNLSESGVPLRLIKPEIACVHLYTPDHAVPVFEDLDKTVEALGRDGPRYAKLIRPFLNSADSLFENVLAAPLKPRNPLLMLRFGLTGIWSAQTLARHHFLDEATRGMFAGMAAHSMLPPDRWLTGAVALMFCVAAHSTGWPIADGGAAAISGLMAEHLRSLGGEIETGRRIDSLNELPPTRAILLDTNPAQMLKICGEALPKRYRRAVSGFRYGPGVYKIDWALDGPIPWLADSAKRSGTVHLGGSLQDIGDAEQAAWNGQIPSSPFLLVTQPGVFDSSRAPPGKHVAWAYCHVPPHCEVDLTSVIEQRIERFAPGFSNLILARHVLTARGLQDYNANYVGGDISAGVMNLKQMLARPAWRMDPWSTPNPRIFLCSASTPPGPGVHGMCGYYAAQSALARTLRS